MSPELFCYCFEVPLEEARAEPEASLGRIRARVAEEGCWCERSNPSGKCCLTETSRLAPPARGGVTGAVAVGVSSAMLATAASACCVPILAPLVVTLFGVSGAIWSAGMGPWAPWLSLVSGLALGWAMWTLYRPRRIAGVACPLRRARGLKALLWIGVALWGLGVIVQMISGSGARLGAAG